MHVSAAVTVHAGKQQPNSPWTWHVCKMRGCNQGRPAPYNAGSLAQQGTQVESARPAVTTAHTQQDHHPHCLHHTHQTRTFAHITLQPQAPSTTANSGRQHSRTCINETCTTNTH